MPKYVEKKTAELVDLLFKEGDKVTLELARELIGRGEEAAAPLREILANEDYWYEGKDGELWVVVHAINILSAMRDERALPVLIEMVPHAYFSNHDPAVDVLPAALEQFGAAGVEPYMKFISEHQGAYRDNSDFAYCRWIFSSALTRIALKDEALRARIFDFVCGSFEDPKEDDKIYLSFSAGHPIALDKDPAKLQGLRAVRAAYDRGVMNEEINGDFKEFAQMVKADEPNLFNDLTSSLLDFYKPDEIKRRQKASKEMGEENLYWSKGAQVIPAGYAVSEAGGLQRTDKVGRNDPCPCNSGKKYKKCCGQ
jgi:uncharacterized protein YktA (UPF0223 family)